jgi:prolyl-tRNA editing enzyme YbaK/EbsC (Cys-tRNA(Pro) deacylase)
VISNGTRQVDPGKLANHLGVSKKRVRLATGGQVEAATGYPVGTVPPFGHPQRLPTLIESQVLQQREIYAGGGAINALVRLTVAELQRVLQTPIVDLAKA